MISIIIPTFNEEKVLENTLNELKKNIHKTQYEIIVSDAKSSDNTAQIAKKHATKLVSEKKKTIARGRNLGASVASGEYLVFIDADVLIPDPDKFFDKIIFLFKKNPLLVAITGPIKVFHGEETFWDKIFFGILNFSHLIANNIINTGRAPGELQIIRASTFKKLNGYRENLAASEDYELFIRLSRSGQTRFEKSLAVFHSGRRAHSIGWPKLLWKWTTNALSVFIFKRSASKDWESIR